MILGCQARSHVTRHHQPTITLRYPLGLCPSRSPHNFTRLQVDSLNSTGHTPFLRASGRGHLDVVIQLLDYEADAENLTRMGQSALELACAGGHEPVISYLLRQVAVTMEDAEKAFLAACHGGHLAVAIMLAQHGVVADNATTSSGYTAMSLACKYGTFASNRFPIPQHSHTNTYNMHMHVHINITTHIHT